MIALGAAGVSASAETSAPSTVFQPSGAGYEAPGTLYSRQITLHHNGDANGTILATWENYTTSTPYFPIYQSTNGGSSWTSLSRVTDTVNDFGMRWEPFLYELRAAVGSLPAGTILAAGLSVPADRSSTEILLFDSTGRGATWSFLSSVAKGGRRIHGRPEHAGLGTLPHVLPGPARRLLLRPAAELHALPASRSRDLDRRGDLVGPRQ
ncbi:hypothetical protein GCM10023171_17470 [Microbacterium panaciterrae]|uniref:Exo-alpha-sialidase n=1 Tax=Microbacterium panaciterrae TaxID=985759 RepID=A0ABP8PA32_9MICO